MMKKYFTTKRAVVGLLAAGLIAGGTMTALAFFTGSGTGSGTATVASDSAVNINSVSFGGQLYPGHTTPVTFTLSNASPSVSLSVGSVIADPAFGGTNSNGVDGLTGGCTVSDFSFAPVTVTTELGPSSTLVKTGGLFMTDATTNQDACKGQSPTLHLITKNP